MPLSTLNLILAALKEFIAAIVSPLVNLCQSLIGGAWTALARTFHLHADEIRPPLFVLVSILVIAVSAVSVSLTLRAPASSLDLKPFEALGEITARETIKLVGDRGRIVVVTHDTRRVSLPGLDAQIRNFARTLRKESHLTVATVEQIGLDQETLETTGALPGGTFLELLRKYSQADALVSFLGTPVLSDAELDQLPPQRPKVVVALADSPQLGQLLTDNIVQAAITPRVQSPNTTAPEPRTREEWFNRFYLVVTRDTVDQLPYELRRLPDR